MKAVGWFVALMQIMIRERPQIVILASVNDSNFGLWLYRWLRIPFIVFAYGNELLETIQKKHKQAQEALRLANRVLAISRYTAGIAQEAGADPERIKIVWPGCDSDFFRPMVARNDLRRKVLGAQHRDRVILTVGNLVSRKGQDMVIRALPALCRRVPDLVYMIVGDGPYRGELEKLALDLGVRDRVVFAGQVSDEDLPDVYALCEVFILASREHLEGNDVEGFGMVLLEASACGKPVVGGRSGGVPDALVDGVTGLLVDPLNPEEITGALASVLTDHDLAAHLGEQGRLRVVQDFQWGRVSEYLLSTLKSVQREGAVRAWRRRGLKP
jgi:phosphatidylinositol alpha-1,6-mannosyltransferase